jgi:hypothetical protein
MRRARFLIELAAIFIAIACADSAKIAREQPNRKESPDREQLAAAQTPGNYVCFLVHAREAGAVVRVSLGDAGKVTSGRAFIRGSGHRCYYRSLLSGTYTGSGPDLEVFMTLTDGGGSRCSLEPQETLVLRIRSGENASDADTGMGEATGECRQTAGDCKGPWCQLFF